MITVSEIINETELLRLIFHKTENIMYINDTMKTKNFYLKCIQIKPFSLRFLDINLQNDKEFIIEAFVTNNLCIRWINKKFKCDEDFMLNCITINIDAIKHTSIKLLRLKSFAIKAIKINCNVLKHFDHILLQDDDVIIPAIMKNLSLIKYASPSSDTIIKLVSENGLIYEFLSDYQKKLPNCITIALKQNHNVYKFFHPKIQNSDETIKKLLSINGLIYDLLTPIQKLDIKLMVIAVNNNPSVIHLLPLEYKFDKKLLVLSLYRNKNVLNESDFPLIEKNKIYSYVKLMISRHDSVRLFMYHASDSLYIINELTNKRQRTNINILNKLNQHGKYYGKIFKTHILEYIGILSNKFKRIWYKYYLEIYKNIE